MDFPEPTGWDQRSESLLLECTGCKSLVELRNGDFEYDICAVHGGLVRHCDESGLLTVWKRSQEALPPMRTAKHEVAVMETPKAVEEPQTQEELVPLADAMDGVDRRSRVRAKVNFFACVKTEAFGTDIVTCIDMSRGGVSFRTRNLYEKGMELEIAVPFSPEGKDAPAIFVRGRIRNVKESAGIGRCGVEFLKS
jgi:hypothetical protein